LEHLLALDLHRMIHERGEGRGHGIVTNVHRRIYEVADDGTLVLVGHRRFLAGIEAPRRKPR
jgi:hypothetical protein